MIGGARRLLRHPPRLWGPLIAHRASAELRDLLEGIRDRHFSTYLPETQSVELRPLLGPVLRGAKSPDWLPPVADLFLQHRFDWLGLGWRTVGYGTAAPGLQGYRYDPPCPLPDRDGAWLARVLPESVSGQARKLWKMIEWPYEPIDWQRDHRSGYRWEEGTPSRDLALEPVLGADPKQPWELARLQHLPLLALGHALTNQPADALRYAGEFRNVVIDFAAANPPRFGINWRCSMDVAIRICNILLAWDLFRAHGAMFDPSLEELIGRMAVEHGTHLRRHLEKRPDFAANHYLANLVGLLFAAAFVPGHSSAREWRRFAGRELARELCRQFNPDGSNFEASVGYHRLSGEMCVYAAVLMGGIGAAEFDGLPIAAIFKGIGRFVDAASRPDGSALPLGDLDSGRLFKLASVFVPIPARDAMALYPHVAEGRPDVEEVYWEERLEEHAHLAAACASVLTGPEPAAPDSTESRVLAGILGRKWPLASDPGADRPSWRLDRGEEADFQQASACTAGAVSSRTYEFPLSPGEPQLLAFRDFGLFVVRTSRWHLAIRCGTVGQNGNGGHAHNDQLSLTLFCDGKVVVEDPGVFVYNALPEMRRQYRSVKAHFAPRPQSGEPGNLDLGPFRTGNEGEGRCHWFGALGFVGSHEGFGYRVARVVRWNSCLLLVRDFSFGAPLADLMQDGAWRPPVPLSSRYGCARS